MQRLFGIPMGDLALALALLTGLLAAVVVTLAVRNRVLLRLGLRHLARRRARAALVVVGLMLGTAIISAALSTGDTMARTVRAAVIEALGRTDEVITVRGAPDVISAEDQTSARAPYLDARVVAAVDRAMRRTGLVDGVTPAIIEPVAAQDLTSRQTESRVSMYAPDPARMAGFGEIRAGGRTVSLGDLRPGEVYLDGDAADKLGARAGDRVRILAGTRAALVRVRDVVAFDGAGSDGASVLLPLVRAQTLLGRPGRVRAVLVSNDGDATSGATHSAAVVAQTRTALAGLGLEAQQAKKDGLKAADQQGDVFISVFTTFGSFSIAAGILLIFLIFVMLSAERRSELGIARAIGTRRGHLVQLFVFEGLAYDLGAAAVGAALGVGISFAMVSVMAGAFSGEDLQIQHAVSARSIVVAYALGVLLTFAVVAFSAWRVSAMNIVAAVRDLPEPPPQRARRRRVVRGGVTFALGVLMAVSGLSSSQATPFSVGLSLAILGLVALVRAAGVPERAAFTVGGALLLVWWLLPFDWMNAIVGRELSMDFSAWVVSGLVLVAGATWLIVYNADVLLGAAMAVFGRLRALTPVLKMAMAYPLRVRFRTGVTLAMFTLVVFTIVVGATTSRAFLRAVDNVDAWGGGFDVRATVAPASPVADPPAALRRVRGLPSGAVRAVGAESVGAAKGRQVGDRAFADVALRGFDPTFLHDTSYALAARARGYGTDRAVWDALAGRRDLAVADAFIAPRRSNWGFGMQPDLKLHGFFIEDKTFDPVRVQIRDAQTRRMRTVTVVGVLADTVPQDLMGLWTSQATATALFGPRAVPTTYFVALAPGVDPDAAARGMERTFLAHGMEAKSSRASLHDVVGESYTLNWLLLGFMGLGLVVGVAALGVISARSVVERRQQIGVLRSIGFQRRMVQLSFLLESSFIALSAIAVGSALGLVVARNVIADSADQPSYQGQLHFAVPWTHLGIVFAAVYLAALLTTLAPAARASRVYPAEALRYE